MFFENRDLERYKQGMSAPIQAAVQEYEDLITNFCSKYHLCKDIKKYMISCGLDVKKKNLTNQTRTILATALLVV